MQSTAEQIAIAKHRSGHALVVSAPGSGKTTTSVEYLLSLLRDDVDPKGMLVLMFGRAAEEDFVRRLKARAGTEFRALPAVKTYHKLGAGLCREFAQRGLMADAVIESSKKALEFAAMAAIRKVLSNNDFRDAQNHQGKFIDEFVSFIDIVKSGLSRPEIVFEERELDGRQSYFVEAYAAFEKERADKGVRYFADLLYDPVSLMLRNDELRQKIENKKTHVLVDEYQDTNEIQNELLKIIAGSRASVMAVGDVDQAIFEWRGARPDLMLHGFRQHFVDTKVYTLSKTFRYGHQLALMANSVIRNNSQRMDTLCSPSENVPDTDCSIIQNDESGEAVSKIVQQHLLAGDAADSVAVLVRLYSASVPVELAFLRDGIPYRLEGGSGCFALQELKNMIAVLEIAAHEFVQRSQQEQRSAIEDLFKFPSLTIKNEVIKSVAAALSQVEPGKYAKALDAMGAGAIPDFQKQKLVKRAQLMDSIHRIGAMSNSGAAPLVAWLVDTNFVVATAKNAMSAQEATESIGNCNAFLSFVKGLGLSPALCLREIEVIREAQRNQKSDDRARVSIMSIHRSKGLEFPTVIMPGLAAKQFPFESDSGVSNIESERRLFFVGITRAMKKLYLVTPKSKSLQAHLSGSESDLDVAHRADAQVSPFVYEIAAQTNKRIAQAMAKGESVSIKARDHSPMHQRYLSEVGAQIELVIEPAPAPLREKSFGLT